MKTKYFILLLKLNILGFKSAFDLTRRIESLIHLFYPQNCLNCVIWYIFSFHYSIFFTLPDFFCRLSLMMLSLLRISFGSLFLRFDWVDGDQTSFCCLCITAWSKEKAKMILRGEKWYAYLNPTLFQKPSVSSCILVFNITAFMSHSLTYTSSWLKFETFSLNK